MSSSPRALVVLAALLAPCCKGNVNDGDEALLLVTDRVSLSSAGSQGNGPAQDRPAISRDGRFVAFTSFATDLVPGDTNAFADVFLRDRATGTTVRVSVSDAEAEAAGESRNPSISADGRWVAFDSSADGLVPFDANGLRDVFVRDTLTGATIMISEVAAVPGDAPSSNPSISADGRFVAFVSAATNLGGAPPGGIFNIYLWDRTPLGGPPPTITPVSLGADFDSGEPSISPDGQFVAFTSFATNLPVAGGYTNSNPDVFLWDSAGPTTTIRVSVDLAGGDPNGPSFAPSVSVGGLFVAFQSTATDLIALDANGPTLDIFLRDIAGGTTTLVSRKSGGAQGTDTSSDPVLSEDGSRVAFRSVASNLVDGDSNAAADVFLHDRVPGVTVRSSVRTYGGQTPVGQDSSLPAISGDGRFVAFVSVAGNLVSDDTNGVADIFVRGP